MTMTYKTYGFERSPFRYFKVYYGFIDKANLPGIRAAFNRQLNIEACGAGGDGNTVRRQTGGNSLNDL
jgi:hypothetical protein